MPEPKNPSLNAPLQAGRPKAGETSRRSETSSKIIPIPGYPDQTIDLRDPALAAFLAWLIPGLGHLYQRRLAKAVLYFVAILGTFIYGVYLGGSEELGYGRVVYASWQPEDRRLHYLCQIWAGLPALPALIQANRVHNNKTPLFNGFMAPPSLGDPSPGRPTLDSLHKDLSRYFELGTLYTMVAGLLNVLAIYDAWGGPVFTDPQRKRSRKQEEEEESESDSDTSVQE